MAVLFRYLGSPFRFHRRRGQHQRTAPAAPPSRRTPPRTPRPVKIRIVSHRCRHPPSGIADSIKSASAPPVSAQPSPFRAEPPPIASTMAASLRGPHATTAASRDGARRPVSTGLVKRDTNNHTYKHPLPARTPPTPPNIGRHHAREIRVTT